MGILPSFNKFDKYKRFGSYHWRWYGKRLSYTRHVDYLKRFVKEKNTINIGAGDGLIAAQLRIYGVDSNPYAIKLAARRRVKIDLAKGNRLPYTKEQFDSALVADSLQNFKSLRYALSETRRVIKKYLYVSSPISQKNPEPGTYHVWKDPNKLVKDVEKYGFKLAEGPILKLDRKRYYFKFEKA